MAERGMPQVHLFIFIMAVVHILGGILLIVFASLRMRMWRRWEEADDAYALQCALPCSLHAHPHPGLPLIPHLFCCVGLTAIIPADGAPL